MHLTLALAASLSSFALCVGDFLSCGGMVGDKRLVFRCRDDVRGSPHDKACNQGEARGSNGNSTELDVGAIGP